MNYYKVVTMKKTWITTALLATFVSLPTAIYAQDIQPEPDSDSLIWTDTTTLDYMKYAAESFNQDFGYKVKFSFRGLAPIDAASRMIQDGGSAESLILQKSNTICLANWWSQVARWKT